MDSSSAININILNVRIAHKKSRLTLMETVAFEDVKNALTELYSMGNIDECIVLKICNCIDRDLKAHSVRNIIACMHLRLAAMNNG